MLVEALRGNEPSGFLFENSERFFLEVLYLKLSLFTAIVRDMPGVDHFMHPDFTLSLDRVWVRMAETTSLLPSYWTFITHPIDIYWSFSNSMPPRSPASRPDLHSLALIWFYLLVTNKNQTMADRVVSRQGKGERDSLSDGRSDDPLSRHPSEQAFLPAEVFWAPPTGRAAAFDETESMLWKRSLALGWSLLEAGEKGGEWSRDRFLGEMEALRGDIRGAMFDAPPRANRAGFPPLDDHAIHGILEEIMLKWRTMPEPGSEMVPEPEEEEESVQTVIVSSQTASTMPPVGSTQDTEPEGPSRSAPEKQSDEALEETVILTARATPGQSSGVRGPEHRRLAEKDGPLREDELERTVILSSKDVERSSPSSAEKEQKAADDLEKTVILSREHAATEPGEKAVPEKTAKKRIPPDDEMAKTVILSVSDKGGRVDKNGRRRPLRETDGRDQGRCRVGRCQCLRNDRADFWSRRCVIFPGPSNCARSERCRAICRNRKRKIASLPAFDPPIRTGWSLCSSEGKSLVRISLRRRFPQSWQNPSIRSSTH